MAPDMPPRGSEIRRAPRRPLQREGSGRVGGIEGTFRDPQRVENPSRHIDTPLKVDWG
jgi:hypothetical protein